MTEFENKTLQTLLFMKVKELQEEGEQELARDINKVASKLIALECIK